MVLNRKGNPFQKLAARIKAKPKAAVFAVAKYAVYFALMTLFSNAKMVGNLSPFALGLFIGLVYAKQNILVLSPLYILACLTGGFSVFNLIFSAAPVIVLTFTYLIFNRLNRSVGILILTLCALLSMTPYVVITLLNSDDYLTVSLNVILTLFFTYCSQIGCYAILLRGINYRLSLDELFSLSALTLAFSLSLFSNPVFNFNLFYVFFAYAIMFSTVCFPPSVPLCASVVMGLGCALVSGDIVYIGACAALALAAVGLKSFSKYASALAVLCADALIALYATGGYDYLQLIAISCGLILFLATPARILGTMSSALGGLSGGFATRNIVNQNRNDLASKLQNVGRIFWNMSTLLSSSAPQAQRYSAEKLSESIAIGYCGNCANHESCFSALANDTRGVIRPMVEASLARDKITILDMPPFITSRCGNMQGLLNTINRTGEAAKRELASLGETSESRLLIAEQFGGVSVILDNLAKDIKKRVSFSSERELKITRELARHNIIANEAAVYGEGNDCQVNLAVRQGDTDKLVLDKLVSRALGQKMERVLDDNPDKKQIGEWRLIHLQAAPAFNVAFGIAEQGKSDSVSGDSKIITKIGGGKLLVALCDGMGSGESAQNSSATAIALIENFFRAGFESNLVLSLVNRMLALRNSDDFSTLDLVVVDRMNGELDLVKMGAADSYIIHGEEIKIIESGSPPVGVLDKISPLTMRLPLAHSDVVVLVSDGVGDTLSTDGVIQVIENTATVNPQTLADALVNAAKDLGAKDDCTAIVFRLIEKN
jgi:stage II sporulation protein E